MTRDRAEGRDARPDRGARRTSSGSKQRDRRPGGVAPVQGPGSRASDVRSPAPAAPGDGPASERPAWDANRPASRAHRHSRSGDSWNAAAAGVTGQRRRQAARAAGIEVTGHGAEASSGRRGRQASRERRPVCLGSRGSRAVLPGPRLPGPTRPSLGRRSRRRRSRRRRLRAHQLRQVLHRSDDVRRSTLADTYLQFSDVRPCG